MKRLLLLLFAIFPLLAMAHDFQRDAIYYKIISESDRTVAVTFRGDRHSNYTDRYTGNVSIPEYVINPNNTYKYTVTTIGSFAFDNCTGLTSVVIPNSVTSIELGAFGDCTGLTSVVIPNSVTSIGDAAFEGCSNLVNVTLTNNITKISSTLFEFCYKLTSITIPNGVTQIGYRAFGHCYALPSISIPKSVQSMGNCVFEWCTGLKDVYVYQDKPLEIDEEFFDYVDLSQVTLHVPNDSYWDYYDAEGWKDFGKIKRTIHGDLVIPDGEYLNAGPGIYTSITYTRNFKNTGWQALYVPFEMSYADWCDDFEVGYIEGFLSYDYDSDGKVDETKWSGVKITSGTLHANTPYLIRAKSTGEKTITLNNAMLYDQEINTIDCSSTTVKYDFTGCYETKTYTDPDDYPYGMNNDKLSLRAQIIPFRWYMRMTGRGYTLYDKPEVMNGRMRSDDGLTFLEYIESNKNEFAGCQVYTLDGRRIDVQSTNLTSGLYINNGKKIMVK